MIALLASIGIGGSLGTIIAILENPATGIILKFAKKAVIALSQGKHLSEAEKQFIKDYNHQEVMVIRTRFFGPIENRKFNANTLKTGK
jgi:hypothetical protein